MNDYPALEGRPVTEAHARVCREEGHATHTVGGADTGVCPRCGEVTGSFSESDRETFDRLLELEQEARVTAAVEAFAPITTFDSKHAANRSNAAKAKERLYAALEELTPEQTRAYGEYRKAR